MFVLAVITIAATLLTTVTASGRFIPIPGTPLVGKLPLTGVVSSYDLKSLLVQSNIQPSEVEAILVYVFFTGLGSGSGTATRAFYEIYTESNGGLQFKQFLNAVFNQPDTVINSANLWIPYNYLASGGNLYAKMISASSRVSYMELAEAKMRSKEFKNLDEAMKAYVEGTQAVFRDIYLIGYSD